MAKDGHSRELLLVSACALIDRDGRVLLCTRPEGRDHAGLWEFPGGKVEKAERPVDALVRELKEELGVETEASCLSPFSFGEVEGSRPLILLLYVCRKWTGHPKALEGQELSWVMPNELLRHDMPPVDRPMAAQLRDYLLGV